jgi:hypothetical protein
VFLAIDFESGSFAPEFIHFGPVLVVTLFFGGLQRLWFEVELGYFPVGGVTLLFREAVGLHLLEFLIGDVDFSELLPDF